MRRTLPPAGHARIPAIPSMPIQPRAILPLCTNVTANSAEILLTCPSNTVYEIQVNRDPTTPNWTGLAVVTNVTSSAVSYTDTQVASNQRRFYRAVAVRRFQ